MVYILGLPRMLKSPWMPETAIIPPCISSRPNASREKQSCIHSALLSEIPLYITRDVTTPLMVLAMERYLDLTVG